MRHVKLFIAGLVLGIIGSVAARSFKIEKKPQEPRKPEALKITLHGGPLDQKSTMVPERASWYTLPYLPEDKDEWELMETRDVAPGLKADIYKPHWAFYRQIEDENYFFVREVDEEEVRAAHEEGIIPDAE